MIRRKVKEEAINKNKEYCLQCALTLACVRNLNEFLKRGYEILRFTAGISSKGACEEGGGEEKKKKKTRRNRKK